MIQVWGGDTFLAGDYCSIGKSLLTMQSDGNFVLYDENGRARWASNTRNRGYRAVAQPDGNLVVYNTSGAAIWASNTCCGSYFTGIQADGNVVVYTWSWGVKWATNTSH